ncbi:glutathione S-transferase family protein [Mesorhizobium loti]|nr:glutathione S-transferase family protein [Mesorhizobium loti]
MQPIAPSKPAIQGMPATGAPGLTRARTCRGYDLKPQLLSAPYSPYARMVRVVAHELDLHSTIDIVPGDTWNVPARVKDANPLGKVPTLVVGGSLIVFDSRAICDYLCGLAIGQTLLPAQGGERAAVLTMQSLGTGLMDTMIERFLERWRPVDQQMPEVAERLRASAWRCYDYLERASPSFEERVDLGTIAVAVALSYVSFRFPKDDWTAGRPQLSAWYGRFSHRDSMLQTVLQDLVQPEPRPDALTNSPMDDRRDK